MVWVRVGQWSAAGPFLVCPIKFQPAWAGLSYPPVPGVSYRITIQPGLACLTHLSLVCPTELLSSLGRCVLPTCPWCILQNSIQPGQMCLTHLSLVVCPTEFQPTWAGVSYPPGPGVSYKIPSSLGRCVLPTCPWWCDLQNFSQPGQMCLTHLSLVVCPTEFQPAWAGVYYPPVPGGVSYRIPASLGRCVLLTQPGPGVSFQIPASLGRCLYLT